MTWCLLVLACFQHQLKSYQKGLAYEQLLSYPCAVIYSTNKAKLDEGERTTLLNRYPSRLEAIGRHLNVRKYKKKTYTLGQIGKAQSKYASVHSLVDIQLTGEDGQPSRGKGQKRLL